MSEIVQAWSHRVAQAAAARIPLCIRGGGTKDFYGEAQTGEILDTRGHAGIVEYEPTELMLQARAGTPLEQIERALAEHGQMLAFEPPHFGRGATLGGTIACGLSGPRRVAAGSARDFVLGLRMLDGLGRELAFGGKVMKNVAGYDVSRLVTGSMGTLGVLLEIALKVLPRPECERTLRMQCTQEEAIRRLNAWTGKPYPLSASCHEDCDLTLRLSGTGAGVDAVARLLGGQAVLDPDAFWVDLRDQRGRFFAGEEPLWRLSVRSTAPQLPLPGRQLIEWHGALRWAKTDAAAEVVRDVARKAGGHATLFRPGSADVRRFHPLSPEVRALHLRLKRTFDPAGILNLGRLYPEF